MRRMLCTALLALALGATAGSANILVGQPGPNFTKTNMNGVSTALSDYPGKVVVLFLLGYA
ncbi:MAG: hypothetical protein HOP15_16245 [Planctomycetes bacterium]|nr:hypothetical protein [Planctomycetota bacterium]